MQHGQEVNQPSTAAAPSALAAPAPQPGKIDSSDALPSPPGATPSGPSVSIPDEELSKAKALARGTADSYNELVNSVKGWKDLPISEISKIALADVIALVDGFDAARKQNETQLDQSSDIATVDRIRHDFEAKIGELGAKLSEFSQLVTTRTSRTQNAASPAGAAAASTARSDSVGAAPAAAAAIGPNENAEDARAKALLNVRVYSELEQEIAKWDSEKDTLADNILSLVNQAKKDFTDFNADAAAKKDRITLSVDYVEINQLSEEFQSIYQKVKGALNEADIWRELNSQASPANAANTATTGGNASLNADTANKAATANIAIGLSTRAKPAPVASTGTAARTANVPASGPASTGGGVGAPKPVTAPAAAPGSSSGGVGAPAKSATVHASGPSSSGGGVGAPAQPAAVPAASLAVSTTTPAGAAGAAPRAGSPGSSPASTAVSSSGSSSAGSTHSSGSTSSTRSVKDIRGHLSTKYKDLFAVPAEIAGEEAINNIQIFDDVRKTLIPGLSLQIKPKDSLVELSGTDNIIKLNAENVAKALVAAAKAAGMDSETLYITGDPELNTLKAIYKHAVNELMEIAVENEAEKNAIIELINGADQDTLNLIAACVKPNLSYKVAIDKARADKEAELNRATGRTVGVSTLGAPAAASAAAVRSTAGHTVTGARTPAVPVRAALPAVAANGAAARNRARAARPVIAAPTHVATPADTAGYRARAAVPKLPAASAGAASSTRGHTTIGARASAAPGRAALPAGATDFASLHAARVARHVPAAAIANGRADPKSGFIGTLGSWFNGHKAEPKVAPASAAVLHAASSVDSGDESETLLPASARAASSRSFLAAGAFTEAAARRLAAGRALPGMPASDSDTESDGTGAPRAG